MSTIKKLLKGVEVEWKSLGEVAKLEKGKQLNKELLSDDGLYPAYNGGVSHSGFTNTYNYNKNTIIISQGGASAGFVNFVKTKFYANAHCYVVLPNQSIIENRYVYHFLKLSQEKLTNKQHGAGIPALRTSEVLDIQIPIPPLHIQSEIVRILDNFTELTAELTAELYARKKQYQFYRDKLLSFEDGEVEWKSLGEVAKIQRGRRLVKSELEEAGNYAVFQNSMTPLGYYHEKNVQSNTTFIISAGAAGEIGYSSVDFWAADDVYYFTTSKNLKNKFLYYFLLTQKTKIISQVRRASVPRLSKTAFEKMNIPIPPLAQQEKIVSILDKFDTLTNSISEGLPREIALRQQQYEYYRNLLLSFSKKD
jgi:type I restriction enzyme S subunit